MTGDDAGQAAVLALMLLLPLSALASRRIGWRRGAMSVLAWLAIFAVLFAVFVERARFAEIGRDIAHALDPEAGERRGTTVRVAMAADGHFWVRAQVNGRPVRFLIDSGASTIALGRDAAIAAGLEADNGIGVPIETANGTVIARRATIATLDVNGIARRDMGALIAPEFGETNVLGMNFLSSLAKWSVQHDVLVLEP